MSTVAGPFNATDAVLQTGRAGLDPRARQRLFVTLEGMEAFRIGAVGGA